MKKISVSVLSALLALLMVLSVSCGTTPSGGESSESVGGAQSTQGNGGEVTTEPPKEEIRIAEGSTFHFALLRPEEVTESFFALYTSVAMGLESATGGMIECKTDLLMPGTSHDPEAFEILFGNCNAPATDDVKNSLGLLDYTVRMIGNKIVIFGHNKDTLAEAANAFLSECISVETDENGETVIFYKQDYTYETGKAMLFTEENPLSGYTVVYPDGNATVKSYAERLATRIERQLGITLPVVSDASAEQACEIVIGNTARMSGGELYADVKGHEYCLRVFEKKLYIGAQTDFALADGMDAFIRKDLTSSPYSNAFNFLADHYDIRPAYYTDSDAELYEGTDLRIMSWNMLTELWNDKIPVDVRDEKAAAAIMYYAPDVVGMQEITPTWYDTLENMLGDTYAFVTRKNQNGSISYNGLFYNKETVKLVEHGVTNYSVGASTMRLYTWGLFERISDGERFVVSSTHWDTGSYPDRIAVQAKEMATLVKGMVEKYGVPVFNTGDYNCREDVPSFYNFLLDSGFKDARGIAKNIGSEGATYHSPPLGTAPGSGGAIDHITVSPDVEVMYYTRVIDSQVLDASDHCPIYIDVSLKTP